MWRRWFCCQGFRTDGIVRCVKAGRKSSIDLGYSKAEGAYPFVDGQYVRGYSFEQGALEKNQTFTIPYADLLKAHCFDREFKKLIDSGQFGEKTIQRLRNDEEYPTSVQTVLALCVGLKLRLPEAEMFLGYLLEVIRRYSNTRRLSADEGFRMQIR